MLKLTKLDREPSLNAESFLMQIHLHCCYFWTSVVFLKSFYQGFKCHKSLQHRVWYCWKQSSLWFRLWGAIRKSKEEHHLTNELANGASACWAAPGFTLVWSKIPLKYHIFKKQRLSIAGYHLQFKFLNHLPN
jgi:hypothetical protein